METIIAKLKNWETSQRETYLLLFLFSFGIDASFGYHLRIIYIFTLLFILLLLMKFIRPLYVIITLFLTFVATLYFPIGRIFGNPNYNSFISAIYTNPEEAKGFLMNIPTIYYIGSGLLTILGIFIARLQLNFIFKRSQIIFMVVFVLTSILYKPLKQGIREGVFCFNEIGFTPIRFLREAYTVGLSIHDDHRKIQASLNTEDTWEVLSTTPKYQNYVLVIGESVRKDFMHNYGFSIKNTPFATTSNGFFFENYISAGPSTIISLTNSLAKRYKNELQLQNNIISLAKKSGFHTYWISNQDYLGEYDTPVSIIGKHADSELFIKTFDPIKFKDAKDELLLPFIKTAISDETVTKPKLIVVHLIGSHPPLCKRTDDQFDTFFHSKNISCYIRSIYNTDQLLEKITIDAKSAKKSWSMLYFSDHGLALENGVFGHNDKYQENYRVPMFIISSDDTKRENITAYRSALHFTSLFAQWTGIQEKSLQSERCYLSNINYKDQTSVILANKKKIDINHLLLNMIKDYNYIN